MIFDTDENHHFLLWSQHHSWSKRVGGEHTGLYSSIQAIGGYIKSRNQFMKIEAGMGGSHLILESKSLIENNLVGQWLKCK